MKSTTIDVVRAEHVAAHFHLMAHFDLGRELANAENPSYMIRVAPRRPRTAPAIAKLYGRFHAAYRSAPGRHVLPLLPLTARTSVEYAAILDDLVAGRSPPEPATQRVLLPLAGAPGIRLVSLLRELVAEEGSVFFSGHWFSGFAVCGEDGHGLDSYLRENLMPFMVPLYGEAVRRILVFPTEAAGARSWSFAPTEGELRIATAPGLRAAFFHALVALVRGRTDALIHEYLPEDVRDRSEHPLGHQMRVDVAMTAAHHLIQRHRSERLDEFRAWALRQFENTRRLPTAAFEALQPMRLVPAEAVPILQSFLTGIPVS